MNTEQRARLDAFNARRALRQCVLHHYARFAAEVARATAPNYPQHNAKKVSP